MNKILNKTLAARLDTLHRLNHISFEVNNSVISINGISLDGVVVSLGDIYTLIPKIQKQDEKRLLTYLESNPTPDSW